MPPYTEADKVWQILTFDFCHIADFCGILDPLRLSWTSHTEVLTLIYLLKTGASIGGVVVASPIIIP